MSAKFFALLTVIGANKLAKATALGTTLKITQMAVGDGGGTLPTPDTQQTKLVGEKRRAGLNTLFVDPKNDSQIIAEQVIPENEGGYWIREIGLFDDEGSLIAVGNCPETYKPQLQEGSGRTQTIRMILTVSHTESVELKVDPSVILATREFVNDAIESTSKEILKEVEKNYATKEDVKKKFNIDNVVHEKGASKEKVISQFGVTEFFQPKGAYPTKPEMTQELNKKVDKSSISQQLANDVNKVPSLDLVTRELGKKQAVGDYADKSTSITQYFNSAIVSKKEIISNTGNISLGLNTETKPEIVFSKGADWRRVSFQDKNGTIALTGDSYLKSESDFQLNEIKNNVYSISATDSFLNKKVDKENISQQLANDVNKVPSLDLVTRELGKKQASGNYADKSSSATQSFSGSIIALKEVMSRNGNISLGIKTVDKPEVVFNFGTIWRKLSFQDKDGTIALSGDSYTKAESNKQLDDIKNNVYSKSASDGKYGLKNTISKLDNGWWKCGDTGLIYQYGIVSGCVSSDESRSFPIPFPNKCLSMVGGYLNENEWGQGISMRVIDNKTFFSVARSASGAWAAARAYYIAIGY